MPSRGSTKRDGDGLRSTIVAAALVAVTLAVALLALPDVGSVDRAATDSSGVDTAPAGRDFDLRVGRETSPSGVVDPHRERVAADVPDALIVGRCVDWESGQPLVGCRIITTAAVARSQGDGRFELRGPSSGGDGVLVRVLAEGRLGVEQRIEQGRTAVGDVRLRRGSRVFGRVHDEAGTALSGVVVGLQVLGSRRGDGWAERWTSRVVSGFDGEFELPEPLPQGVVAVGLTAGPPLIGPKSRVLNGRSTALELVCAVGSAAERISGTVVDERGQGVAGALVEARRGSRVVATARSNSEGQFVLHRAPSGVAAVGGVELMATVLATSRRAGSPGQLPWGAVGVVLPVVESGAFGLRVLDAESGAPVECYAVQCVPEIGVRSVPDSRRRESGRHRQGMAWLRDVREGPNAVIVWPEDPLWLPNLPVSIEHTPDRAGRQATVLELRRAEPCPIRVEDAAGQPVVGAEVELVWPAGDDLTKATILRDHEALFDHGGIRGAVNVRLARARTDRFGRAMVRWWLDPTALEVRVRAAGRPTHRQRNVRLGATDYVIRLADAARLDVTSDADAPIRLVLRSSAGDGVWPAAFASPLELASLGRAQFAIPAGEWQVHVAVRLGVADAVDAWIELPDPVAKVALRPGSKQRLGLDVSEALVAGDLQGTALVDGAPARQLVLLIGESDPATGVVRARHTITGHTDSQGRFRFRRLFAGHCKLELRLAIGGRQVAVPVTDWLQLAPGEPPALQAVAVVTAPVRLRVRDASGRPVTGRYVELFARPGIALIAGLDAAGEVAFDRVPAGDYRVRLRAVGQSTAPTVELERLSVPGGAAVEQVLYLR